MITFRKAERKDIDLILWFVRELAVYEKLVHEMKATPELYEKWLFEHHIAEVIFVLNDDRPVGFVLYFYNFSTFVGKAGIYIEDLYVLPEHRGKGYGKALMSHLAKIAVEKNLGRMEWTCLDWNITSINFYKSIGARAMDEWTNFRLSEKEIEALSKTK